MHTLLNEGGDFREHVVHDAARRALNKSPVARSDVEGAHLIAPDDAVHLCSGQFNNEAAMPRKVPARRNRRDKLGAELIEGAWGDDDHRTVAALFAPCCRIEIDKINVAAFH